MSLHPMTLADYLSTATSEPLGKPVGPASETFLQSDRISSRGSESPTEASAPPLLHCFHLQPSISILLAILEGVEHLHEEGIVHRDLKPGNIFLGTRNSRQPAGGTIDLMQCSDCRAERKAAPITLEVRIGDFGLVTFADSEAEMSKKSEGVGTEMYRPSTAATVGTSLDTYALGIIAFELLWKFDTRMERIHTIQRLKQGEFPPGFSERIGKHGGDIEECIRAMLTQDSDGVSVAEIKRVFSTLHTFRS